MLLIKKKLSYTIFYCFQRVSMQSNLFSCKAKVRTWQPITVFVFFAKHLYTEKTYHIL